MSSLGAQASACIDPGRLKPALPGIELRGISRRFGTTQALSGVSLTARAGAVHAVIGENGAGKSTLMRILFGLDQPDEGSIAIDGAEVRLASPRAAKALGIGMVHQHFTLVPTLTVLDSCVLAAGSGLGGIDRAAWRERLEALTRRLHWQLPATARIDSLGVGARQRVEILKALLTGGRALILDEPTAVLTPQEVDELLPALRALADAGTIVLFISHKLHEVERLCDQVTILRRGQVVHDGPRAGLSRAAMAELMVGAVEPIARPAPARPGTRRLAVDQGEGRRLHVDSGEIVAIAGVDGNGQAQLVQAILHGEPGTDTPGIPAGRRLGGDDRIALIPDDRQHEALVLELPVAQNLVLKDHRRRPFCVHGWLRWAAWRRHAQELIARFAIAGAATPATPVAALSGGNQQKVVIARELQRGPGLIVAVNPTRGLDLAASADVMRRLVAARDGGAGVLLLHHDLDELLAVADRVLVIAGGRLTDSRWPDCDRARIGALMLGAL